MGSDTLRCEVTPVKPELNYALRLRAGYEVRIPLSQYQGPGHRWRVLVRVTPESGNGEPVYLASSLSLLPIPQTKFYAEFGGGFLVGDGHYSAALLLTDDLGRVCSREWQFDAHFDRRALGLENALPPGSVVALSRTPANPERAPVFERLTAMIHVAAASWRDELVSVLEQVPARKVRLVLFNLEQQKLLFRQDNFQPSDLNSATDGVHNLLRGAVDYHILQHATGDADLLADLVNRELQAAEPSDAVILVSTWSPSVHRVAPGVMATLPRDRGGALQRYFYIRYVPTSSSRCWAPCIDMPSSQVTAETPMCPCSLTPPKGSPGNPVDMIGSLVATLKGTTLNVRSPADFAKAIRAIVARK